MSSIEMTMQYFEVHHFKLFRKERLNVHPDMTVLAGRNDVGKSILLDAIELYGRIQRVGFREPLSDEQFKTAGTDVTRFVTGWMVDGESWTHSLVLDANAPEERFEHRDDFWSWNPKTRSLKTRQHEYAVPKLEQYTTIANIEESQWKLDTEVPEDVYGPLLGVADSFATPIPYLFEPSALRSASRLDIQTPSSNGYGWAAWLQEIINRRNDDLAQLESHIRELFPFFGRVRVREERVRIEREVSVLGQRDGLSQRNADAEFKAGDIPRNLFDLWRMQQSKREVFVELGDGADATARIDANNTSSGLLLALAHFALLYADNPGRLVLLEEPENGLNPQITLNMMESFLEAARARKRQVILTTHNGWWLDLVAPESIRVLTRDSDGSRIIEPDPARLTKILDELDVYPSEVVNAFGPEGLTSSRPLEELVS